LGNWLASDSTLNYTGTATLEAAMNQSEWRMTGVYRFEFNWHDRFYIQVSEEVCLHVYPGWQGSRHPQTRHGAATPAIGASAHAWLTPAKTIAS
jgi:hypothetical protein